MKRFVMSYLILCLLFMGSLGVHAKSQSQVDMEFKSAPLVDVFQILGEIGGYNVLVDSSVKGEVSLYLKDLTLNEALDLIARTTGFRYRILGNTLIVATEERLRTEFTTEDVVFIQLHNVDVGNARQLVSLILPSVKSYGDAERQLLILYGGSADLKVAEDIIEQYDQNLFTSEFLDDMENAFPTQLRSMSVVYGDGDAIMRQLEQQFPHREFMWDAHNRTVIGKATSDEWQQVEELIAKIDVPSIEIRGILASQQKIVVLAECGGIIYSLGVGDELHGWTLVDAKGRSVEFARGNQRFTVGMRR